MSSINYTNRCYICMKSLSDYMMLPYEEDYFGEEISIFKDSMIIKNVESFQFLYFTCCNKCIDNLIKFKYNNSNDLLKYLKNREIGKIK